MYLKKVEYSSNLPYAQSEKINNMNIFKAVSFEIVKILQIKYILNTPKLHEDFKMTMIIKIMH